MIRVTGAKTAAFNFPVGEKHVRVMKTEGDVLVVSLDFEKNEDLIELLLLSDAFMRLGRRIDELIIPYVPFSRQDRVMQPGEPLSIAVAANLINMVNARRVIITDPHSDVTTALIRNAHVIRQDEAFEGVMDDVILQTPRYYLVSPDAGAEKKIFKLAAKLSPVDVVQCSKVRDIKTGQITDTHVPCELEKIPAIIVDDICDGGATFIKLGEKLKEKGAGDVILFVTHGFFTKGKEVFKGKVDRIFTSKGEVKL